MDKFRITAGLELTNKYEKAKQDLLQALKSYGELSQAEKEELMREFLGAANVAAICDMFNQNFR